MQSTDIPGGAPSFMSPFEAIGERYGIDWTETREAYFSNPDGSEEAFVQRAGAHYKLIARGIDGKLSMAFDIHGHLFAVEGDAVEGLLGSDGPLSAPAQAAAASAEGDASQAERPQGAFAGAPAATNPLLVPIAPLDSEFSEQIWAMVDMLFWSLGPMWLGYTDQPEALDDFTLPAGSEAAPSDLGPADGELSERLSRLRSA